MSGVWKKVLCWGLILCCIGQAGCGKQKDGEDAAGNGSIAGGGNVQGEENSGNGQDTNGGSGESGTGAAGSGNGGTVGSNPGAGSGYMDIQSDTEEIFVKEEGEYGWPIGLQFYQGEPIQLWAKSNSLYVMPENEGEDIQILNNTVDVYLNSMDGSSKLLAEGLPGEGNWGEWYLAQDGSIYNIYTDYERESSVVAKRDETGEVVYEQRQNMRIADICQLSDGRIFVVLDDNGGLNGLKRVGELNPDTGVVTELSQIKTSSWAQYIGADGENLLLLDTSEELREIDLKDDSAASILVFSGTSYDRNNLVTGESGMVKDLRILEDGSVEILRSKNGITVRETLRLKEIGNAPIVIRGYHFNNGWIKDRVAAFNKSNDNYHIVLEEPGEGGDWEDFAKQTSIQIATGKGPDILYGEVLEDYLQGMIDKGAFEDLRPYMESSGIREEDYFPGAFPWRQGEKIYGINPAFYTYRYSIDASVLGGGEPNIETLVNALYSRQEKAMYMRFCGAGDILQMFLEGTEDFWGMINWEEGTCDFSGELFARMMEVAKRYAYDENQDYPILAENISANSLYNFDGPAKQEGSGTRTIGVMFDDGCYPAVNSAYHVLAINTNSVRKQGAWEFVSFLLGEESQLVIMNQYNTPVRKETFETYIKREMDYLEEKGSVSIGHAYLYRGKYVEVREELFKEDVTEEWLDTFRQAAEEARPLPIRTVPVLEIILEEAEDYFNGIKNIDDVAAVIKNRVQLYLDENYF